MRILILSHYYDPEPIPRPSELARALKERGHSVSVITGFPNYPSGKLYEGYKTALLRRESVDGINVVRTYMFAYHGRNALGRMANYLSFMLSAPLGLLRSPAFDAIYVWHPPLTIGVAAWMIGRIRGVPFLYDVQDIWPESVAAAGMLQPGIVYRFLESLARFVYRRAAHVAVVTDGARKHLMSADIQPEKISTMPNWVEESEFPDGSMDAEAVRAEHNWGGRTVILFAGNLGLVQALGTIVEAAELLRDTPQILFTLAGDGTARAQLEEAVRARGLSAQVQFLPPRPRKHMPALLQAADALLVHLKRSLISEFVIPSKTFAYMAAGKPILMAVDGAPGDLIRAAGCGVVVPPEDPAALADAARGLHRMDCSERMRLGQNGQAYARAHFNRSNIIGRFEELFQAMILKRPVNQL